MSMIDITMKINGCDSFEKFKFKGVIEFGGHEGSYFAAISSSAKCKQECINRGIDKVDALIRQLESSKKDILSL